MKKLTIFPALLLCLLAAGQPAWKQHLKYRLQVRLDDQKKALDGKMDLCYTNHSPDTLHFIWFHVWPNAYRNDRSSYSDQLIGNGKTGFYFSEKESRGYMNRLEFRVNGVLSDIRDHPEYIDVIKLLLPKGLAPGDSLIISSAFHVKLPYNFSGFGYRENHFQINNWYPEPAVYDSAGWHPMPFLEQGGAYHEAADYEVEIEIPEAYTLASGSSANKILRNKLTKRKTCFFSIQNANAFAWVADKQLIEKKDSIQLETGKVVALNMYYLASDSSTMQDQINQAKYFIRMLSGLISEYPYPTLSLVETFHPPEESFSGMVVLDRRYLYGFSDKMLLSRLTGQWVQAACPSNERLSPWMSKGFMQYYYERLQTPSSRRFETQRLLKNNQLWLKASEKEKTTQPVNTAADSLSRENYILVSETKSALWLKSLEDSLGKTAFDKGMHDYFETWKFSHPGPSDFKVILERSCGKNLKYDFEKLNSTQTLFPPDSGRKLKLAFQYFTPRYSPARSKSYNLINIAPALGYNNYDRLMAGLLIHNYTLPENDFQFLFVPLYSWSAKSIEGLGRISYSWYPERIFRKIIIGISGSRFSDNFARDSTGHALFEKFSKLVPYLRIDFNKKAPRSTLAKWMDLKSFLINEHQYADFAVYSGDALIHPNSLSGNFHYLNQLSINIRDERVLYPFDARLELQQTDLFYRLNLNANYFFNYASGGGMRVRVFAAGFGVWKNNNKKDLSRYEPKLLGTTGEEDYTYTQYFIGRSDSYAIENSSVANSGLAAQQIAIRDGGLKMRIDPYDYVQGRSTHWVSALNFSTSLPGKLFPAPVPLRVFFDVGTYAEAWKSNAQTSRFLYTGGVQLSLFKNVLNIYAPLIYSSDFRDPVKGETFWKKLTFSIDIQNIDYKKILKRKYFKKS